MEIGVGETPVTLLVSVSQSILWSRGRVDD